MTGFASGVQVLVVDDDVDTVDSAAVLFETHGLWEQHERLLRVDNSVQRSLSAALYNFSSTSPGLVQQALHLPRGRLA